MGNYIDVYPYCLKDGVIQFLLLRRSKQVRYAGQWRMVGGKVKSGETAWQAALRELKEETGNQPEMFWAVPSINHFYDPGSDKIALIPAFAARLKSDCTMILDDEHSEYQWIEAKKADHFIHWPEQLRLIKLIQTIITSQEILDDWKISNY